MPSLSQKRQHPVLVSLGDSIRRLRLEKEISQEKLALLAEIDRSYMGRIERGTITSALLTLVKMADALEVSVAELMIESEL